MISMMMKMKKTTETTPHSNYGMLLFSCSILVCFRMRNSKHPHDRYQAALCVSACGIRNTPTTGIGIGIRAIEASSCSLGCGIRNTPTALSFPTQNKLSSIRSKIAAVITNSTFTHTGQHKHHHHMPLAVLRPLLLFRDVEFVPPRSRPLESQPAVVFAD